MTGDLSWGEVEALGRQHFWRARTLRDYIREELLSPSQRGRGRGREPTYRWPAVVSIQIGELARAQKHSRSWTLLRHWMWWELPPEASPVSYEHWHADRMLELTKLAQAEKSLQAMAEPVRDRLVPRLVMSRHLPKIGDRGALATQWVDAMCADPTGDPEAVFSHERDRAAGRHADDDALEKAFPAPHPDSAPYVADLLRLLPRFVDLTTRFQGMEEGEARYLLGLAKASKWRPSRGHCPELRETPRQAALVLALFQWSIATLHGRPLLDLLA